MQRIWSLDNTKMGVLLIATIIVVYMQPVLSYPFFIVLFYLAYKSDKSYFWLAYIFILLQAPGELFSAGMRTEIHRLPLFSFGPGISFSTFEVFMVVLLVKSLQYKSDNVNIFKRDFAILAIVMIIYLIIGIMIGLSSRNMIMVLRGLVSWSWIIIIPSLLHDREDVRKLMQLLFPIVILAFGSQIYSYISGYALDDMLRDADPTRYARQIDETTQFASRMISGPYLILICFAMTLYYLIKNDKTFPSGYLYMIMFISCLTIFLSATRGWIIAFTVMLIIAMFSTGNILLKRTVGIFFTSMIILYILITQFPVLERQMELSWERMKTLESLAEGDVTAGGTLGRIDQRGSRVMRKFMESPLIGFGFSDEFRKNTDEHVGHHSLLLNVGILGYILIMGYFLRWIILFFRTPGQLKSLGYPGGDGYQAFGILLIGILIIHSSSTQFIGFYFLHLYKYFVYAFLFGVFLALYNDDLQSQEVNDK